MGETLIGYGVPAETNPCHVAEIDRYVVAGHVPGAAVARLLVERPAGVGLVVPGMPSDSPGMGGEQEDWLSLDVLLISSSGELSIFDF